MGLLWGNPNGVPYRAYGVRSTGDRRSLPNDRRVLRIFSERRGLDFGDLSVNPMGFGWGDPIRGPMLPARPYPYLSNASHFRSGSRAMGG